MARKLLPSCNYKIKFRILVNYYVIALKIICHKYLPGNEGCVENMKNPDYTNYFICNANGNAYKIIKFKFLMTMYKSYLIYVLLAVNNWYLLVECKITANIMWNTKRYKPQNMNIVDWYNYKKNMTIVYMLDIKDASLPDSPINVMSIVEWWNDRMIK